MLLRFLIVFFILCPFSLASQQPLYKAINTHSGLASNEVYDVFQDSKGFIWIATAKGVSKCDGNSIINYSTQEYSSEGVSNFVEDKHGRIWFNSFWGQFFYIQNDSLHYFYSYNTLVVNPVYNNTSESIVFTSLEAIEYIDLANLKRNSTLAKSILPDYSDGYYFSQNIGTIDSEGEVFYISSVHNNGNFGRFIKVKQKKITEMQLNGKMEIANGPFFFEFMNIDYVYFNNQIYEIKDNLINPIKMEQKVTDFFKGALVSSIRSIAQNELLISTYNKGALLLDKKFTLLPEMNAKLFSDFTLSNGIKDREGNYWFGTLKQGVLFVPKIQVKTVLQISKRLITSVEFVDTKTILLGYDDGSISLFNIDLGSEKIIGKIPKSVKQISKQFNGEIYIIGDLFYKYNKVNSTIEYGGKLTADAKNGSTGFFNLPVVNTSAHTMVLLNGLNEVQRNHFLQDWHKAGYIKKYEGPNADFTNHFILNDSRAFGLAVSAQSNILYTSATNGLTRITPDGKSIIKSKGKDIFSKSMVFVKDILYCATDNGLIVIKDTGVVKIYTTQDGLSDIHVFKVKYIDNSIFIINLNGIDILDLKTGFIANLIKKGAMNGNDIYDLCLVNNSVYVSSEEGLISIPFKTENQSRIAPLLYLNAIYVNAIPKKADTNKLAFTHTENNIRFSYTGIHFKSSNAITYYYRLLGNGDTVWMEKTGSDNFVAFNNLEPGDYEFQIKAKSSEGIFSELRSQKFSIALPFWNTWWFYGICVAALLSSVVFYNRYTLRKRQTANLVLLDRAKTEKELQQSQLNSLKVQMNPHFMFNALNSIQEFILTNEKKLANQYLGKFSDLMRMTLDMSQEEKVLLADEIKVLRLYLDLEQLRFGSELIIKIELQPTINPEKIQIPSMLIQPYVENALKHGLLHRKGERNLHIYFSKKEHENVLVCVVDDDGVGRVKSAEIKEFRNRNHRSFASSATKRRLELLNSGRENAISAAYMDKVLANGDAIGTTVTLEIPYTDSDSIN